MSNVTLYYRPSTTDGWQLELKQTFDRDRLNPSLRPLLLVPGYGMNTFILGFHPTGKSLEQYFVDAGFEVWSANLRGQGGSRRTGGRSGYGFAELALVDLPTVMGVVRGKTKTGQDRIDVVGCSLGASILYTFLAHHLDDHGLGSLVSIGGPLRWDTVHPAVKIAFASPRLVSAVPIVGTRRLARVVLPVVKHMPGLLSIYMNAAICDLSQADQMVRTVDNPNRRLNVQIAKWIAARDLIVDGRNVTEAMASIDRPLMCVLANADGIVTPESALSVRTAMPDGLVDVLTVGDDRTWFAHADLFVSEHAQERVFEPLRFWLVSKSDA